MNYIPQVAKMLGVEMGERFRIINKADPSNDLYFLDENGLHLNSVDIDCNVTLRELLTGNISIKKLPWKPVPGETIYVPIIRDGETIAKKCYYEDTEKGEQLLKAGFICRNKQEAEEKAKAMLRAAKDFDAAREVRV